MFFKNTVLAVSVFVCCQIGFSQVGINTASPQAQLEIVAANQATPSNTDGILIPKIDAFPVANPTVAQNGMMVFLTATIGANLPGFYYWDNPTTSWITIGSKNNWGLAGNSGTTGTANFIGTIDNNDFTFKRNSIRAGKIEAANTSLGVNSFNPANTGINNTAIGDYALSVNSTGSYNVAVGSSALTANTTGTRNTAIGVNAMLTNVDGGYNTAVGTNAMRLNSSGGYNTALGSYSFFTNSNGYQNTTTGTFAMHDSTIGSNNVSDGAFSLMANIDGNENTALGTSTLISNTHGHYNTAVGMSAMHSNISGINNTALGAYALSDALLTGINNTAIGGGALDYTVGSDNTGLGYHAGYGITTGSNNIAIGSNSNVPNSTASDQLSIDNVIYGTGMLTAASAKIGIGEPAPAAKLQIASSSQAAPANTDGIIIPKVDAFPLTNPTIAQNGMMVFLTTTIGTQLPGFYYWNNPTTSWVGIGTKNNWGVTGNTGTNPATNFIGTSDTQGFSIRTNNTERIRIDAAGNIAIGNFAPNYPLQFSSATGDKISLLGGGVNHFGIGMQSTLMQLYSADTSTDIAFGSGSSATFTENVRFKGNGNVGINAPIPNSKLQINASSQTAPANTDGIIIPKVDAFPTTNPAAAQNGMMVFLTTAVGTKTPGFYYWDDLTTSWISIGTKSNWSLMGNSGTNPATNFIGSADNVDVSLKTNNTEIVRLTATGKVGIGAPIPGAELEVNGFTKSGSSAPAVKMVKLTGTTGASQGATTNIAHGIVNSTKILGVTVLVEYSAANSVPSSYNGSVGYEFDYYITPANIAVWLKSGNSANILSKPIRILVTYEQ